MNVLSRLLQFWMAWVVPRPRLILALALATAIGSGALAVTRLEVHTDQLELITPHHSLIELTKRLEPYTFGGKTLFTVVIDAPDPDRALAFLERLAPRVAEDRAHFQEVLYRVAPESMKRWALLYLDKKDLLRMQEKLEAHAGLITGLVGEPDVIRFLELINREMASQMVGELFTGFLAEGEAGGGQGAPPDLTFLIQTLTSLTDTLREGAEYSSPWTSFLGDTAFNLEKEGYFWEGGKRYLLMLVIPEETSDPFIGAQGCLDTLRGHIRAVQSAFPDVKAGVTGQEALNTDEMTTVMKDMQWATWLSIGGILILMIGFFRSLRRSAIEMITLGVGLCWTFGWTTLFIGHLNILSVVFAPLLCGLGVDYGIHWFSRFEEERDSGMDRRSLVRYVTDRSGPGIFLAALSGAFSFLPLTLTGFAGLRELGLITGMGILLIFAAGLAVLPALSILFPGKRPSDFAPLPAQSHRDLLRFHPGAARLVVTAAGVACLMAAWSATRVGFDLNPLRLQAVGAESVVWEKALIEGAQRSPLFASAFAESPEQLKAKSNAFQALPSVSDVETVFHYLPQEQEEKLPIIRKMLAGFPAVEAGAGPEYRPEEVERLKEILERFRFKMQGEQAAEMGAEEPMVRQMSTVHALAGGVIEALEAVPGAVERLEAYRRHFRQDLVQTLSFLGAGASVVPMGVQDLPPLLRDQFTHDGQFLMRIFPKESVWEQDALTRFVTDLQGVDPEVVGDVISLHVFATAFKVACILASLYALIAIAALLVMTLRSWRLAMLALVPLLIGTIWTVGIMGLVGVDFNLANSIFMPLIVGAGVEYGIIILQRWREGDMAPGHLPLSTGKGIILAALTTTVGFGTLMISAHRGIFSLGFVAWVGSICVLIAAVVLLPAILALRHPRRAVKEEC